MRHVIQPNRWSCLPSSFAMACDQPLEMILKIIGHDGSYIEHPGLEEPYCRRAFHIQECIWAAHQLGFSVTPFECFPQLAAVPGFEIPVDMHFDKAKILAGFGVLTGQGRVCRHAIAFSYGVGYDPNGQTIDLQNHEDYEIETIWKFDLIS